MLFGTPVRIEPTFFLIAFYLALNERTVGLMVAWVAVLFVGILVHEMGHAFAFHRFGSAASVVLWGFGGLTMGAAQPPRRSVVVSLAGPLTGLVVLGLPAWWLRESGTITDPTALDVVDMVVFVNVFWSLVNLLPVLPLDGGNIARDVITLVTRRPGDRPARLLSIVTAGAAGLYAWLTWQWTFALIFGAVLVVMNVAALRRASPSFIRVQPPPRARRRPPSEPTTVATGSAGGAPAGGAPAPVPAPAANDVQPVLVSGYQALDHGDTATAIAAAEQVLAANPYPDTSRLAVELLAWAHLRDQQPDRAREAIGRLPRGRKASRYLRAALTATAPEPRPVAPPATSADGVPPSPMAVRVADLVDAFLFAGEGPDKVQAAAFCASWGLTVPVTDGLLAAGPDGLGQAIRLEDLLQRLGRLDAADEVRSRLLPS